VEKRQLYGRVSETRALRKILIRDPRNPLELSRISLDSGKLNSRVDNLSGTTFARGTRATIESLK